MRYFKQYGCKRTGTNYLRALLERNFSDIIVLMHTLGGKHDHPVDLKKFLYDYPNDPVGFVAMSTQAYPAETTHPFDPQQKEFIKNNAVAIFNAISKNQIHYLVSIKNPYAWINSNKDPSSWINGNYRHMLTTHGEHSDRSRTELLIKLKSIEFNSIYSSYLNLAKKFPDQTTIVKYEDILTDPFSFLDNLKEQLQLKSSLTSYSDIKGNANPTIWDQTATPEDENAKFSKDYYLKEKYLEDLSPNMIDILEMEIDWELMKNYGYYKRN
ncbi:hypothetical protein [Mucilaginibacter sp. UYCu711]|uniref:hypothetical protein n=1 Tax=Mucilaginibacter sp. UYCu711 TaxID=3156339 RepID=UPI003D240C00